jgi:hypothetical protein
MRRNAAARRYAPPDRTPSRSALSTAGVARTNQEMAHRWLQTLAMTCIALGARAVVSADGPFDPWLGSYRNTRSAAETQQMVDAAIERGIRDMRPLQRRIARSRLKAVSPASAELRIVEQEDRLATEFDGRRYSAPANGSPAGGVDPQGKRITVSYHVVGDVLHARYVGGDGETRMDFEPIDDGQGLTVQVTVMSKEIPEPVRYNVHFRRE